MLIVVTINFLNTFLYQCGESSSTCSSLL